MELCDFHTFSEEPCHRQSYNRKTGLTNFNQYSKQDQEVLLWRAGGEKANTICFHHAAYYGRKFYHVTSAYCSNVFFKNTEKPVKV